jgi:hypothetical protein
MEIGRKLCLIGAAVVGSLILPAQADAGSAVGRTNAGGKYVHYGRTNAGGKYFILIPVASTFIPVTQHGGRGGRHRLSHSGGSGIAKLPSLLGRAPAKDL